MKVLIISTNTLKNIKNNKGGIETYIKELMNVFDQSNIKYDLINSIDIRKFEKEKNGIKILFKNYDLIINNNWKVYIEDIYKQLYVVHFCLNMFKKFHKYKFALWFDFFTKLSFKEKIYRLLFYWIHAIKYKSPLKYYKNIVIFNRYFLPKKINDKKYFFGYLPTINNLPINYDIKQNKILYMGRFSRIQKNVKLLNKIANKQNINIDCYGFGPDKNLLKSKNINIYNEIQHDEFNKLKIYKVFLITSNYEGCCITAHELISLGVIPIMTFFSKEIYALIPEDLRKLLIIKNKNDTSEWKQKINHILSMNKEEYLNVLKKIRLHVKETYYQNCFHDSWISIVNQLHKEINEKI